MKSLFNLFQTDQTTLGSNISSTDGVSNNGDGSSNVVGGMFNSFTAGISSLGRIGEILAPVSGPQHLLHMAIVNGDNQQVQTLLAQNGWNGGNPMNGTSGIAPIHVACKAGNFVATELMLDLGTSVKTVNSADGNTPLHYAAISGNIGLVQMLVKRGSSVSARNHAGFNAYDACQDGSYNVRQFLLPLVLRVDNDNDSDSNSVIPSRLEPISSFSSFLSPTPYIPPPPPQIVESSRITRTTSDQTGYHDQTGYESLMAPIRSHPTLNSNYSVPNHVIAVKADGFRTSATDKELQKKYSSLTVGNGVPPPPPPPIV